MFKRLLLTGILAATTLLAGCSAVASVGGSSPVGSSLDETAKTTAQGGATVRGQVVWGSAPVAGARVELRTGAWAINTDPPVASVVADASGAFVLTGAPEGEFGLVAVWPEGGANTAPVTPVQVPTEGAVEDVTVYLARELTLVAPVSGAAVEAVPELAWEPLSGATLYRVFVMDAGTTELVLNDEVTETTMRLPQPLTAGHTYQWDVVGVDADGAMLGGLTNTFVVRN